MYKEIQQAVLEGEAEQVEAMCQALVSEGTSAKDILELGLLPGMEVVGQRFRAYEMYLPEVIGSAEAMKAGMGVIKPLLAGSDAPEMGKILIATIEGDLHDIGKNLVSMMLEGAGFAVIDLGVDVPVSSIVSEMKAHKPDVVALSALLTTTMLALEGTIQVLRRNDGGVKVMVGGAPITQAFADKIGADGFAPDALRAIDLAKRLIDA